jgi:hypothetical protein
VKEEHVAGPTGGDGGGDGWVWRAGKVGPSRQGSNGEGVIPHLIPLEDRKNLSSLTKRVGEGQGRRCRSGKTHISNVLSTRSSRRCPLAKRRIASLCFVGCPRDRRHANTCATHAAASFKEQHVSAASIGAASRANKTTKRGEKEGNSKKKKETHGECLPLPG